MLSKRVRAGSEAAPWVIEEITALERELVEAKEEAQIWENRFRQRGYVMEEHAKALERAERAEQKVAGYEESHSELLGVRYNLDLAESRLKDAIAQQDMLVDQINGMVNQLDRAEQKAAGLEQMYDELYQYHAEVEAERDELKNHLMIAECIIKQHENGDLIREAESRLATAVEGLESIAQMKPWTQNYSDYIRIAADTLAKIQITF